jgi:hypothetical protein
MAAAYRRSRCEGGGLPRRAALPRPAGYPSPPSARLRETPPSRPERPSGVSARRCRENQCDPGFVEELREQLTVIQGHQLGTALVNFVHSAYLGTSAITARRSRASILALPNNPGQMTPISAIPRLRPNLAAFYAGKTRKMLTRDITA